MHGALKIGLPSSFFKLRRTGRRLLRVNKEIIRTIWALLEVEKLARTMRRHTQVSVQQVGYSAFAF